LNGKALQIVDVNCKRSAHTLIVRQVGTIESELFTRDGELLKKIKIEKKKKNTKKQKENLQ
jgi:hypothetical protein